MSPGEEVGTALILGVALTTLALTVYAAWLAWRIGRHGDELLQRLEVLTREGRVLEALDAAHALPGAVATVVRAGLPEQNEGAAEAAMAGAAQVALWPLDRSVQLLDLYWLLAVGLAVVHAAGLMGDVPIAILRGMAIALGAAILATLGRFWLLARIRRLAIDMEKAASVVYNTAR